MGFLGSTDDGRILLVVYTRRDSALRVVTARDAEDDEERLYRRRRK